MTASVPEAEALAGGFADPARDSLEVFRAVMEAMAQPGRIRPLAPVRTAPAPLDEAAGAVCLCLVDLDTPLWLDPVLAGAAPWLRFHTGCRIAGQPERAAFAVVAAPERLGDPAAFAQGQPDYPERSTTVIVQVAGLQAGAGWTLRGPGIDGTARLNVPGFGPDFLKAWAANNARFPCGIDLVLTAGDRVAALPRTVRLEG